MEEQAPPLIEWNGQHYRILLAARESETRLGIFEGICPPGAGPPRHRHRHEDETFTILSGQMQFWLEGEVLPRGPGEMIHLPRGREHSFVVVGSEPARYLVHLAPGGFEGFFSEAARRQLQIPRDLDAIRALADNYGMDVTGPPLGATPRTSVSA